MNTEPFLLRRVEPAPPPPLLIVLSAPSGGGKTTLCQNLMAADPELARAITCTTRPPREHEQQAIDYIFLDPETFQRRVAAGEFLEHATVYGNRYGTLKSEVLAKLRQGRSVLLNIDVQGADAVRTQSERDPELKQAIVSVFLTPPSISILEARLRRRGTESEDIIRKRLGAARQEISAWKRFDYLLVSTTEQEDLRRMQAILDAERMRQSRATPPSVE